MQERDAGGEGNRRCARSTKPQYFIGTSHLGDLAVIQRGVETRVGLFGSHG